MMKLHNQNLQLLKPHHKITPGGRQKTAIDGQFTRWI